jgi:Phospholipase_D-nuclease N-terminal
LSPTLIAALAPLLLAALAFEVYVLLDLKRAPEVRGLPKWGWVLVVLASIPLGGIAYLLFGRGSR